MPLRFLTWLLHGAQIKVGEKATLMVTFMLAAAVILLTGYLLPMMVAVARNGRYPDVRNATDMCTGFDGLCALVQTQLSEDPFSGQLIVFRGRAGDLVKIIWWSGDGLCVFAKRLERGKFVWPQASSRTVSLSGAQLSMLLEGSDWRHPTRALDPQLAVHKTLVL